MAKYFASDRRAVEVTIEGARTGVTRTLRADSKGFYNVENKRDAQALRDSGFVEASLMGTTTEQVGYLCPACGFGSWFKVCGRCETNIPEFQDPGQAELNANE